MAKLSINKKQTPYLYIAGGFIVIILIGAGLLSLPICAANNKSVGFTAAFFTAVSSVCVTGLSVMPNISAAFSDVGFVVMAILIQIGGLGFVTTAIFVFILLGAKIGFNQRFLIRQTLDQNTARGLVVLVKNVLIITLCIELCGSLLSFTVLVNHFSLTRAIGFSIFHAVSAFNNAGVDIISGQTFALTNSKFLMLTTALLIILGGLGFIVIIDLIYKKNLKRLSVQSKVVLTTSLTLLVFGTIFIKFCANTSWFDAFFMSASSRTAGFSSINLAVITPPSFMVFLFLMLIGASPASTGGGIKTTTFFVIAASFKGFLTGKPPSVFYRQVTKNSVLKAYVLTVLSILFITIFIFILSISESLALSGGAISFKAIVFETVSAFATCGLSLGVTPLLSTMGKYLICFVMFVGRLGPLTLIGMLSKNINRPENNAISFPDAKIIIG